MGVGGRPAHGPGSANPGSRPPGTGQLLGSGAAPEAKARQAVVTGAQACGGHRRAGYCRNFCHAVRRILEEAGRGDDYLEIRRSRVAPNQELRWIIELGRHHRQRSHCELGSLSRTGHESRYPGNRRQPAGTTARLLATSDLAGRALHVDTSSNLIDRSSDERPTTRHHGQGIVTTGVLVLRPGKSFRKDV